MLDLNVIDAQRTCTWIACGRDSCNKDDTRDGHCTMDVCTAVMNKRAQKAARLLKRRIDAAEAAGTQIVIVCHYPTTWISGMSSAGLHFKQAHARHHERPPYLYPATR